MTSSMQGMDTEWARQMSSHMDKHATAVSGVCSRLHSRLSATSWVGADKDRCRDDLVAHFLPAARGAEESISEQARALNAHADRQDACSA